MRTKSRLLLVLVCAGLAGLVWFVFAQTIDYPGINYDDPGYVFTNPNVANGLSLASVRWAFTHVHGGNWHPLTSLSHMLDCQLFGLNAGYHHLTNVILHALAAILLFLLLCDMTTTASRRPERADRTNTIWRCAFVAAFFAIDPLRVESVAWISERKDVLSAVFFMLTLLAYVRYARQPTAIRYVTALILYALGLLSKPMLVSVPFVLLLLDYWPLRRVSGAADIRRLVVEKIPFCLLAAVSCVVTLIVQRQTLGSYGSLPFTWRAGNAVVSVFIYIRQMFWPNDLGLFYPHPENQTPFLLILAAAVALVLLTVFAIRLRRDRPYLLTGWFWYLLMLVPVLGLVQVGLQGHADRYTYLPQIGLIVLIVWLVADLSVAWAYGRKIATAAGVVAVGILAVTARAQTSYWRNSETIWTHTLAVTSDNDVAQTNLSEVLIRAKRFDEAKQHAEEAVRIRPDNAQAHNNLGVILLRTGFIGSAIDEFKRSLELRPEGVSAASTLAWVLATAPDENLRDGKLAVSLAQRALSLGGDSNPMLLHTLAAAYAELGQFDAALVTANNALTLAQPMGKPTLIKELQMNIDNYRQHLPLRDPGLTNAP